MDHDRMHWKRSAPARWRWRRAERRQILRTAALDARIERGEHLGD
jgi:hypothetical protein